MATTHSPSHKYDEKTKIITAPKPKIDFDATNGAGHYFWTTMKKNGTRIAQIDAVTGKTDTYASLLQRSVRAAIELQKCGIKPGDIVGICSYNHLNSIVPYIASQLIGAIFNAIDISLNLKDATYLLNITKPKIIFVSKNAEKLIQDVRHKAHLEQMQIISFENFDQFITPKVGEDDFKVYIPEDNKVTTNILFSSGTTGLPKGICLNHAAITASVHKFDFVQAEEIFLSYASLYWSSTYSFINMAFVNGASRLICPPFHPVDFWTYVQQYKVTFAFCDPTQIIKGLANIPKDYNYKLKNLLLGGSPIAEKYFKEVRHVFSDTHIILVYAQTELGMICTLQNAGKFSDERLGSCGLIVDGFQCKVINYETGEPVGPNEVGEICIKNCTPMSGYHNMDSSDRWDADGFLKTGDLGYYDKDYYFYVTDRLKEMFKYLAWHIVPAKIEKILVQHPAVEFGIVVGIPHPEDSNHAMGVVTIKKDSKVTAEEIENWMENRLDDRHKLRAGIRIVEAFVYTPTAKIKRNGTRDMILRENK